jgi:hypothetical protein
MSNITYDSIKAEIVQADIDARSEEARLKKKKQDFIRKQSFTGDELLNMRNALKQGYSEGSEPWLDKVLEDILEHRK